MLVLIRGVPGSGKSTAAKNLFNGCLILENDMYHMKNGEYKFDRNNQKRAVNWCLETTKNALSNGMDVVVANTFTKKEYIKPYRKLAEDYGVDFKIIRCNGRYKNVHGLNEALITSFRNAMEDVEDEINLEDMK